MCSGGRAGSDGSLLVPVSEQLGSAQDSVRGLRTQQSAQAGNGPDAGFLCKGALRNRSRLMFHRLWSEILKLARD